jgi:hypothetical protein
LCTYVISRDSNTRFLFVPSTLSMSHDVNVMVSLNLKTSLAPNTSHNEQGR